MQVSVVHKSLSLQTMGVNEQTPETQASLVQVFPSSQRKGVYTQAPVMQESAVHTSLSLQTMGMNEQVPETQVSFVQTLPSAQVNGV